MSFRVSAEVVAFAQQCRKESETEKLPRLDMSSMRLPSGNDCNLDIAQEAIGERLERLMGAFGRHGKTFDRSNSFDAEVERGIALRLGLDTTKPEFRKFIEALHDEYSRWLGKTL